MLQSNGVAFFLKKKINATPLGGTHAFRSNLFAAEPAKRISTAIVAAMHLQMNILTNPKWFSKPDKIFIQHL